MIMKNYLCGKCLTLVQMSSKPKSVNCPSKGSHQWTELGNLGNDNYLCKKCAVLVKCQSSPSVSNCPSNGSHEWTKL